MVNTSARVDRLISVSFLRKVLSIHVTLSPRSVGSKRHGLTSHLGSWIQAWERERRDAESYCIAQVTWREENKKKKREGNFTCKKQSSALPAHQADSPFSRANCGGAGPADEEAVMFSSGIAPVSIPRGSPPNDVKRKTINFGGALNWLMTPWIDNLYLFLEFM